MTCSRAWAWGGLLPLLRARPARAAAPTKRLVIFANSEGYRMKDWAPATGPLTGSAAVLDRAARAAQGRHHHPARPVQPGLHRPRRRRRPRLLRQHLLGPRAGRQGQLQGAQEQDPRPGDRRRPCPGRRAAAITLPLHVQLNRAPQSSPAPGSSRCFWLGRGQPINPIGDPYATYMEIFGGAPVGGGANGGAEDPAIKRLMTQRKSILDYVGTNLEAFKARLGGEDKTVDRGALQFGARPGEAAAVGAAARQRRRAAACRAR